MADFAWFAQQRADEGLFMCSHCYEYIPMDDLYVDEIGDLLDVCWPCIQIEQQAWLTLFARCLSSLLSSREREDESVDTEEGDVGDAELLP